MTILTEITYNTVQNCGISTNVFNSQEYLNVFPQDYLSITIKNKKRVFFKNITYDKVNNSVNDAIPKLGYQSLYHNTIDIGFINEAMEEYSNICGSHNIVAELIRIDPFDIRQLNIIRKIKKIQYFSERQIVYVRIEKNEKDQFNNYSNPCKRKIKQGKKNTTVKKLENTNENIDWFTNIYHKSLSNLNADSYWFFSKNVLCKLLHLNNVSLWKASNENCSIKYSNMEYPTSAAILIEDRDIAYLLLVGNINISEIPGANEAMISEIINYCRMKNHKFLCLGGGRSVNSDDTLLRFKKKFTSNDQLRFLPLGFIIHDQNKYNELCQKTSSAANPKKVNLNVGPFDNIYTKYFPYRI